MNNKKEKNDFLKVTPADIPDDKFMIIGPYQTVLIDLPTGEITVAETETIKERLREKGNTL